MFVGGIKDQYILSDKFGMNVGLSGAIQKVLNILFETIEKN